MPSCRLIKCLVSVFLHTSLVPSCTLFTTVLPKRLYKTPTPYIHYHLQDKTHRSHHGLIKRARQNSFPPHPFAFPVVSSLAFAASFRPPVFISILLNFLSYARDKYLVLQPRFYRLPRVRHSVCHIYFQGQYSLHFFPFFLQNFLSFILCFGCISFQSFPCYSFSAAAPEISVLQGSLKADTHEGFCSRSSLNLPREHAPKC